MPPAGEALPDPVADAPPVAPALEAELPDDELDDPPEAPLPPPAPPPPPPPPAWARTIVPAWAGVGRSREKMAAVEAKAAVARIFRVLRMIFPSGGDVEPADAGGSAGPGGESAKAVPAGTPGAWPRVGGSDWVKKTKS